MKTSQLDEDSPIGPAASVFLINTSPTFSFLKLPDFSKLIIKLINNFIKFNNFNNYLVNQI